MIKFLPFISILRQIEENIEIDSVLRNKLFLLKYSFSTASDIKDKIGLHTIKNIYRYRIKINAVPNNFTIQVIAVVKNPLVSNQENCPNNVLNIESLSFHIKVNT